MFRRLLACALAGSALLLVVPSTAAGAVNSTSLPSSARACLGGGWRSLSDAQGRPFQNQGKCVAFMLRHPVTLADLAGSYVGGTRSAVQNGGTCPPENEGFDFYLTFATTYSGSAAVGTVALHLEGCADFSNDIFTAGTFSLSTKVGSVTGTADGSVTATLDQNSNVTVDLSLTLTVTSGTGAFSTTTGTLRFTQHGPPFAPATGTITA
ncbi:MAG: hypothetical protein M3Q30_19425 [Actinomycetota bacterium]|nr:hypothetical protein [Actinomycetota bacterium]